MVKKALNLQQLIDLSKTIEGMISTLQYQIISHNPVLKKHKGDVVKTPELYEKLKKLYDQLAIIKLAKHKANGKRSKLGVSNQELIFELSSLTKQKSLLTTLSDSKSKTRVNGKDNMYNFQISKGDIENELLEIEKRISKIKDTMTDFNNSHTVKFKYYEELELL